MNGIQIQKKSFDETLLTYMQALADNRVHHSCREIEYIHYDSERKNLVATNSRMMIVRNVEGSALEKQLEELGSGWLKYSHGFLYDASDSVNEKWQYPAYHRLLRDSDHMEDAVKIRYSPDLKEKDVPYVNLGYGWRLGLYLRPEYFSKLNIRFECVRNIGGNAYYTDGNARTTLIAMPITRMMMEERR